VDHLSTDLRSLKIDREKNPERRKPYIRAAIFAVLLVGLVMGALALWPRVEAEIFKTEVRLTTIDEVSPTAAATSLSATGYVVADRSSRVGPKASGRVAKVLVREGELVTEGQILVELDPTDQRSAVAASSSRVLAAQARAAAARANMAEVRVQAQRQRVLVEREVGPRSVLEDLEARTESLQAQVVAADAEVRAARAEMEVLRVGLGQLTVVAPLSGTILDKPVEVGEIVGQQSTLMTIADLATLQVEIDVPETRLGLVKIGGPCEIVLDAFPGRRYRGIAHEIGRQVDRAKATVAVKVRFTEPLEGVLPDMSARVSFLTTELREEALRAPAKVIVPVSAVTTRRGVQVVYVVEDGKVRAEPLRLGGRVDDGWELLEGPPAGTRIVDRPPQTLADGQSIKEQGN
jgi:HlyD family secretion protein